MSPRVLLLDEPASSLTPNEIEHVKALILRLRRNGIAILLIEHVLPFADVLTPNLHEAECITGIHITSVEDMERAAQKRQEKEAACRARLRDMEEAHRRELLEKYGGGAV